MTHEPPPPTDLPWLLKREIALDILQTLRTTLPPPLPGTPEQYAQRDQAAMAVIAACEPANAAEASLATEYVLLLAHGQECLRMAQQHAADTKLSRQFERQAASMDRTARSCQTMLRRLQAHRKKRDADPVAAAEAARTEQRMLALMLEALESLPPEPVSPARSPMATTPHHEPRQPPPDPVPAAHTPPRRSVRKPAEVAEHQLDLTAAAERYALLYPRQARLIRCLGGVSDNWDFEPPEPEVMDAIVTGTSPMLRALDPTAYGNA
jgi:hypothetical protein